MAAQRRPRRAAAPPGSTRAQAPAEILTRHDGAHYVLITGYDRTRRRLHFLNSWGSAIGRGGYGTLDYVYVERYAVEGLVVKSMRVQPP